MESLYKPLRVGLVALPLLLGGCYGADDSDNTSGNVGDGLEDSVVASQPVADLQPTLVEDNQGSGDLADEPKVEVSEELQASIETVIMNIHGVMSDRHIPVDDYFDMVYDEALSAGLIEGEFIDATPQVVDYVVLLNKKLKIEEFRGIQHDYKGYSTTLASGEVLEDMEAYEDLKQRAGDYLTSVIGDEPIYRDSFEQLVRDFVERELSNFAELTDSRKSSVSTGVIISYMYDFEIVKRGSDFYIGLIPREEVESVFENLVVN